MNKAIQPESTRQILYTWKGKIHYILHPVALIPYFNYQEVSATEPPAARDE